MGRMHRKNRRQRSVGEMNRTDSSHFARALRDTPMERALKERGVIRADDGIREMLEKEYRISKGAAKDE